MSQEIRRMGFHIEGEEGTLPDVTEFTQAVQQALPKEWWDWDPEGPDAYGLVCLYPLNDDGTIQQSDSRLRPATYQDLQNQIVKLEERIGDLQRHNDNQRRIIEDMAGRTSLPQSKMVAKIIAAIEEAGYIVGWGDDDQLANLEGSLDDLTVARDELKNTLDEIRTER